MYSQVRLPSFKSESKETQNSAAAGLNTVAGTSAAKKKSPWQRGGESVSGQLEHAAALESSGRWLEAAALYGQLAEIVPGDHRIWANQGNALWLADLPAAAALAYRAALSIDPNSLVSLRGLAHCLRDLNQWAEALSLHDRLGSLLQVSQADTVHNIWARSQILLGLQQWRHGFNAMAQRRKHQGQAVADVFAPKLRLVSEQGFGDTFQYVRFIVPLMERRHSAGLRGGVTLYVEPPLIQVLRDGLGWLEDGPTIRAAPTADRAQGLPKLTLLELAGSLSLDDVGPNVTYLRSSRWGGRKRRAGKPKRVGLCWAARPARRLRPGRKLDDPFSAREYHKRCLPPPALWRLIESLRHQGAELIQLQVGPDAHLANAFNLARPADLSAVQSFHGTAELMTKMDLVISVDTSLAHLCGALGVPGWILLPWSADPRWLTQGPNTPWYASLRLFRQPNPGDWHGAIDQLLTSYGGS